MDAAVGALCEPKHHAGGRMRMEAPRPAFGDNASLEELCPSRQYHRCFGEALSARFRVLQPWTGSAVAPAIGSIKKWFALGLYNGWPKLQLKCPSIFCNKTLEVPYPTTPRTASNQCNNSAVQSTAHLLMVVGIMSPASEAGYRRREATRGTWGRRNSQVLACFVVSSLSDRIQKLQEEARKDRDLLLFPVPDSAQLTPEHAKRAGYRRRRHGHCVFLNYAWFAHSAATWPLVPWIGKVDDDSFVNVPHMAAVLHSLSCHRFAFVGPMQWTSWLREVHAFGIRSLPCGISGSGLLGALKHLSQPMTTLYNADPSVTRRGCDRLGAVPPFPFALGGGYFLSSALNRWIGNQSNVIRMWVAEAIKAPAGSSQIVFFSDTTTGYWISHAPMRVTYVDIAPFSHDICCSLVCSGGRRQPSPSSLLVHGLKRGGFKYTHQQTAMGLLNVTTAGPRLRCKTDLLQ